MGDVTTATPSNFKWLTDEQMQELDMMMIADSSRGYILECDLGKYFIFMYISEYSRDFTMYKVSFLFISEYPHELMIYIKITHVNLNPSR